MSVLIKGMEMPSVCADCDFCIETEDDHKCYRTKESLGLFAFEMTRGMKCPLGYIPKKHGDLIDKDEYREEFMNDVYALCSDDQDNYRANAIIDLFDSAPTIIEASE